MRENASADTRVLRVTCPHNCYDSCGMLATVVGGVLRQIDGDPKHPHSQGRLCAKGYGYLQRTYAPDRLRHPMVQSPRGSGNWQRVTWDRALGMIARKLIDIKWRHGSLLPVCLYKGSGNMGVLHDAPEAMFAAMGPHTEARNVLCWEAGMEAQRFDFGAALTGDPSEVLRARTLLLWGVNPAWTAVHQMSLVMQAHDAGAKVITIDPLATATAGRFDQHIAIRSSSDAALALGMARCILEEGLCGEAFLAERVHGWDEFAAYLRAEVSLPWAASETGVSARQIRELAVTYATAQPAQIWVGFGMQRHANALQAVRAIDALAAITGQIGRPGTGVQFASQQTWVFGEHLKSFRNTRAQPYTGPGAVDGNRTFPMGRTAQIIPTLSDPPVEMLWIAGANPLAQEPNEASFRRMLAQRELVVVVDQFMTATAAAADIVLPATTFLEQADLHTSYWHHCVSVSEPAIEPLYEAKSDLGIAWALSHKLNQMAPGFTLFPTSGREWEWVEAEWNERATRLFGITGVEALRHGPVRANLPVTAWETRAFRTPSGRVELLSAAARAAGYPALPVYLPPLPAPPAFPIRLLTPHQAESLHAQFQGGSGPVLEMHPGLADDLGVSDGDLVHVRNEQGELRLPVRLTRTVPLDTVVAYEGAQANVNLLTSPSPVEMRFPGVAYGDCFVRISPAGKEGSDG